MTNKEKALPYVLSGLGALGVVATGYLSAKNTIKYYDRKDHQADKKKEFKIILKTYWPTLLAGSLTMASIILSGGMLRRTQASLAGATLLLNSNRAKLDQYKNKVKDVLGIENHDKVVKGISEDEYAKCVKLINKRLQDNEVIFYEEHIGFFIAQPAKLEKAIATTNERLETIMTVGKSGETRHCATLESLLTDAEACSADENEVIDKESYAYGWYSKYLEEAYGDKFIHINYEDHKNKDGQIDYRIVHFDKDPIFGVQDQVDYIIKGE